MARPLRNLYPTAITRRRHRTWMWSMTLATLAGAVWGATVVGMELAPERVPSFTLVFAVAGVFSIPGFALGLLTLRAKRAWLLLAMVPLCANGMLIALPLVVHSMRQG